MGYKSELVYWVQNDKTGIEKYYKSKKNADKYAKKHRIKSGSIPMRI